MKIGRLKIIDSCNIYILLWVLWTLQGLFFDSVFFARSFYIPFVVLTLYYVAKVLMAYQLRGVMSAFSLLFIFLLPYGIGLLLFDDVPLVSRTSFLKALFNSMGPVFAFYVFTKRGLLTEKRMRIWLLVFIAVAIASFYVNQQLRMEFHGERYKYDEVTNNAAYPILSLMPFVFVIKKKPILLLLLMGIVVFFVVIGYKRGAILISLFMILWTIYIFTKSAKRGRRILVLLVTIIFLIYGGKFIVHKYNSSDYFQYRVELTIEGDANNREWMYSELWDHYSSNQNFSQLLLGEGAYETVNITEGHKAHNDWLELLVDCGLLGFIVYFVYWIFFLRDLRRKMYNEMVYAMMGACFIFTFMRTLFSISYADIPFYMTVILGYCFATPNELKENNSGE